LSIAVTHSTHPLGPGEYALLGLLRLSPRHGYDLLNEFRPEADLGEALRIDLSNLYAALKRLERQGLVESEVQLAGSRPPRNVYDLTDRGRAEFERWLLEPVRHNREIRLDFILKLYFVPRIAPERLGDLIARQFAAAFEQQNRLANELKSHPAGSFGWVLRQMRLTAVQATIAWLEELRSAWPAAETTG
jgi:PadR family transcriptional regulator, regulatory protein AphA